MRFVELSGDREIDRYESTAARVRRLAAEAHVAVVEIRPGGAVGRHPAASRQLFAVARDSGWVAGGGGTRAPIEAGQAVLWEEGEDHESGSDDGMLAIVVEAAELGP
ncbi:MAG TPA: hypothetical protein VFL61_02770 [Gaiellaceae bacterium]|nr:hypothetical protein [Gaiellaceae bacterium]